MQPVASGLLSQERSLNISHMLVFLCSVLLKYMFSFPSQHLVALGYAQEVCELFSMVFTKGVLDMIFNFFNWFQEWWSDSSIDSIKILS